MEVRKYFIFVMMLRYAAHFGEGIVCFENSAQFTIHNKNRQQYIAAMKPET